MIDDLFSAGSYAAKALRRSLLRYTRRPIEYNFDRLPNPGQYYDMELAFREDFFDPPKFSILYVLNYLKYTVILLLFLVGYFMFGSLIVSVVGVSFILFWPELFSRRSVAQLFRGRLQIALVIMVAVFVAIAYFVTDVLQNNALAVLVVGLPTLFLLMRSSSDFSVFSHQWLYSHPCLYNFEREKSLFDKLPRANLAVSLVVLGILAGGAFFPTFLTLLIIYLLLIGGILFGPLRKACAENSRTTWKTVGTATAQLGMEYFTYGSMFSKPLPGVLFYLPFYTSRRRNALLVFLLTSFTISIGTNFFFAWDTPGFRSQYLSMFKDAVSDSPGFWFAVKEELPKLDWSKLPDPNSREDLHDQLESLREKRAKASVNDKILIDAEIRQLSTEIGRVDPAMSVVAGAWYKSSPKNWLHMAAANVLAYPITALASFGISLLNAIILPALFFFVVMQRQLVVLTLLREKVEARVAEETTRSPWEWFVDRLRNSRHTAPDPLNPDSVIREADHLFLGIEAENGFPTLLHREILAEHAYISGGSGSGKTSLGILSLLVQLIRSDTPNPSNPDGGMPPIVIIDLKGEYALLHTVREEVRKQAEREGRTLEDSFRLFTSEKDMATHYFNPLGDMTYPDRYVSDLANLLLDALELNHGPGYGRSFYSRKNYMLLHKVLQSDDPATFDELCKRVAKATQGNTDDRHQAFELMATLYGLTEFKQLKPPRDIPESDTISMRQVIDKRQVVYFWLPTVESSIIAREVANLALFSYFSAMRARAKTRVPIRQSYLVVDEFQKLAGDRFSIILQQARGFGLSAILSNQSISDLKTPSYDLRPTVLQNTRLKLYFSFADCREMAEFATRSGDELAYMRSGVYELAGDEQPDAPFFDRWAHAIKPRVTTNDMMRVTDHPLQAYVDVRSGSGYTQFGGTTLPLQMFHPIRWSDFRERRDILPWPSLQELGIESATTSTVSPEEVDDRAIAVLADLDERIRKFDDDNPNLRYS